MARRNASLCLPSVPWKRTHRALRARQNSGPERHEERRFVPKARTGEAFLLASTLGRLAKTPRLLFKLIGALESSAIFLLCASSCVPEENAQPQTNEGEFISPWGSPLANGGATQTSTGGGAPDEKPTQGTGSKNQGGQTSFQSGDTGGTAGGQTTGNEGTGGAPSPSGSGGGSSGGSEGGAGPPADCTLVLEGSNAPEEEAWTVHDFSTNEARFSDGSAFLLDTSVASGAPWLLFSLDLGLELPFRIYFELQVIKAAPHNQFDAAIAFLGAYTPNTHGIGYERSQMLFFDETGVGWGDDSQFVTFDTRTKLHPYLLEVDTKGNAQLFIDGLLALSLNNFQTNGRIAFGDQTNDPAVDGAFKIKNIAFCPP